MEPMNSAGSQYKNVLSGKEVGQLVERGTKAIIKGAYKARSIQGQYKTAKYAELRENIRDQKSRYEESQAKQKESLNARRDVTSQAGKTQDRAIAASQTKARQTTARIRTITKNLESGYALPQKSGPSLSAAQSKSSSTPKAPKTPLINKEQQELNETYD